MSDIGIMGGTFDPIHNGHLQLAAQALKEYELDKILFLPTHISWMKKDRTVTEENHRLEMVRLAIEDFPNYELSMVEIESGGNSYTYQTLETLKERGAGDEFYFILGADSLLSMEKWLHPERILQSAIILAAVRDDCDKDMLKKQAQYLIRKYHGHICLLDLPPMDISSTKIRNEFYDNPGISEMLPEKVAEYIRQNQLYRS